MTDPTTHVLATSRCWTAPARELASFGELGVDLRPWNWLELEAEEAALVWEMLASFVEYLNGRYAIDLTTRVPPCWAEHDPIVEELTTLAFAHWQAFSSDQASITGAQYWHSYTLPGFYERVGRWLKGTRTRCDVGRHREPEPLPHGDIDHWRARTHDLASADVAQRRRRSAHARSAIALPHAERGER